MQWSFRNKLSACMQRGTIYDLWHLRYGSSRTTRQAEFRLGRPGRGRSIGRYFVRPARQLSPAENLRMDPRCVLMSKGRIPAPDHPPGSQRQGKRGLAWPVWRHHPVGGGPESQQIFFRLPIMPVRGYRWVELLYLAEPVYHKLL